MISLLLKEFNFLWLVIAFSLLSTIIIKTYLFWQYLMNEMMNDDPYCSASLRKIYMLGDPALEICEKWGQYGDAESNS